MILDINVRLEYEMINSTDLILQIEAQTGPGQRVLEERLDLGATSPVSRVAGNDGIGQRVLISLTRDFICTYNARIEIDRPMPDISSLSATTPHQLPSEAVRYLMPSRYCHSDCLMDFVAAKFGHLTGGRCIMAMRDWIWGEIAYVGGSSNAQTTANDTIEKRQGVCRDFAHVLIALARAAGIPARFVSVYAPSVIPQDFHAVAEVYLEDAWHMVDATKMAKADQIARIGIGLDAAEVSFLSSYDPIAFRSQTVQVTQV